MNKWVLTKIIRWNILKQSSMSYQINRLTEEHNYLTDAEKITFDKSQHAFMITYHTQLCLTLCDALVCSPPCSSVCGIFFRHEYWRGLPFPSPGEPSQPRDRTQVSHIASGYFTLWATREAHSLHNCAELASFKGSLNCLSLQGDAII